MKKLLFLLFSVLATVAFCFGGVGCNSSENPSDSTQLSQKLENAFGAVLEGTELENFTFFTEALGAESETRQEVLDILEESGVELDDKALAVLDLALMSGEAKVQPNGKVTVTVPAFLEDSITEYKVYHVLDNGTIEELAAEYKDGNIIFETSSFSYFVITTATTFNATEYYETHSFENVNAWVTVGDDLTVEDDYEKEVEESSSSEESSSEDESSSMEDSSSADESTYEHTFSTKYEYDDIEHWFVCECGETSERIAHDFELIIDPSTCTVPGLMRSTCKQCDYTNNANDLPLADHTFGEWVETKPATCTAEGEEERTCLGCGETETRAVAALKHDIVIVLGTAATCTEDGREDGEYCKNCDYEADGEVIPMLGHSFGDWVETKAPSAGVMGEEQRTCDACGEVETREIPALVSHEFGEWVETKPATCGEEGEKQRVCSVCGETETKTIPATGEHAFGDWTEVKAPTLEEEGEKQRVCSVCDETETYNISKLQGYTVVVSGGTVNRVGENLNQSSIYVAEDEIVTIKANTYEGYTFFQWNSDCGDIIPTETFDLRVQRNTTFTICFKEALAYGEWTLETERSCEQDGRYYREDTETGLREYIIIPATGHNMDYEDKILVEATCMQSGIAYNECYVCGYKKTFETGKSSHTFGDYEIVVEANGSKVGQRARTCTVCGETQTKDYIKAVYPQGNLKITFDSDDRQGVMTSDRNEIHWMLGEKEYCYYVMRDRSGHSSGTYLHFFFYYKDEGANSPIYMMKKTGYNTINSTTLKDQYGSYGWGLATYVDSFDEYMKFIDENNGRSDNGLNSTSLYDMYRRWEERFNEAGGIPNGFYEDGTTEYLGYTCTIWSNGNFYYYVNEDNCCLLYGGLGYNRQYETVEKIEEITEIPYGDVDINSVKYTTISIKYGDGSDSSFRDDDYFDIESIHDEVSIHEYSYISKREKVTGWEVRLTDDNWVKIEGLEKEGGIWKYTDDGLKTYKRILDEYFDGKLEEVYIRAIREPADMTVTVKVTNGDIYAENTNWGSENVFPAAYEIEVNPEYEYNVQDFEKWLVTIDGVTTEYTDYTLELTLPDSGLVLIECVLIDVEPNYVTINVVGPGKVNKSSCYVQNGDMLELIASPKPGKIFVGWYVVGLYYTGEEGDIPMMLSIDEEDVVIEADYSQYGECFGNKYRQVFKIDWPYEPVVITAVFEDYTVPTEGYYDVTIEDGFVASQNWNSLLVTALRLYQEDYINFFERTNGTVAGWDVIEDQDGTPVTTSIEDSWGGHWIMYDTTITARMQE